MSREFLELFPADHYVISADGKHDNPDFKTITGMTEVLGNREYTVHITNNNATMKKALDALEAARKKPGRKFKIAFRDPKALSLMIKLT